jgi:hypothetical protein
MIRDQAHQYCQEKLMPRVLEGFRNEKFDKDIMSEMGQLNLLGPTIEARSIDAQAIMLKQLLFRATAALESITYLMG